ncbi:PTS transporter subunit EIIB [Aeromonas caviae]|uniref:PTS transporter subunit EIIB n=1 Tax=Aeromonas caviae TaxID=648 RepID=UPI002B472979|nr:PTS transporter subunit EIIB [Aeromonas caviae]
MAINYADSAKQIVELIGGDSNVISVTHCATRLRFVLKEMGRVDKEVLKRVQGVITVIESSGQLQVVIGNHVGDAYREVQKRVQIDENAVVDAPKVGMVNHLMDIISSIFAPFLYPLAPAACCRGSSPSSPPSAGWTPPAAPSASSTSSPGPALPSCR